jgi:hypothetical protein
MKDNYVNFYEVLYRNPHGDLSLAEISDRHDDLSIYPSGTLRWEMTWHRLLFNAMDMPSHRRQNLPWVHQIVPVDCLFDGPHHSQSPSPML